MANMLASIPEESQAEIDARERAHAEAALRREQASKQEAWRTLVAARGTRYADCSLKGFEVKHAGQQVVVDALRGYCGEMPERVRSGEGILLYGPKGTGKDHLLAAAMRVAILQHGISVRWENGQDLYGAIRDRMASDFSESDWVRSLCHPKILAISDPLPIFGELTSHQANMLFRVIDKRYSERKPTWATLNVATGQEAEQRIGGQIVDRLRDGALCLRCNWPSWRAQA